MASCAAIARAFPLFSLKTTKSGYESIEIELVLPNEEEVFFWFFRNNFKAFFIKETDRFGHQIFAISLYRYTGML